MIAIIITTILATTFFVFFSGMNVALEKYDKLVFDIDIKNGNIKQGIIFRPVDNIDLCRKILSTGETFSIICLEICIFFLSQNIQVNTYTKIAILIALSILSIIMFKNLPSALFSKNPNKALRLLTPWCDFFSVIIYPIVYFVVLPAIAFSRKKNRDKNNISQIIPQIKYQPNNTHKNEAHQDYKILEKALDFTNIRIRECLVPRNEIVAIDINDTIENLAKKFVESGYSKILIYKQNIDNILGYVNALALFKNPQNIKSVMVSVINVPETMTADKLFNLFIKKRRSVAIVNDEFGGTQGMLTIEDIIEEITGEIEDEHDIPELVEKQIKNNEYIFSGRLEIDYINEKYKLNLPKSENFETLAGYILNLHQDIPENGDEITDGKYKMKILLVNKPKIITIKLTVLDN